jgi:phenylacetate-CoA ligase
MQRWFTQRDSTRSERWRRLVDLIQATRLERRRFNPVLRWTPEQLAGYQEHRWRAVAKVAALRTPFYRKRYRGIDLDRAPVSALPPVEKGELMECFDDAVTDSDLRLEEIEHFLPTAPPDDTFRGRFHVLLTSGTTGERGLIVYNRDEWVGHLAASFRSHVLMGLKVFQLPRERVATFISTNPRHISCQSFLASHIGLFHWLAVDPQEPLGEVLPRLEQFQPQLLFGYPSVIAPLAHAALEGQLRLRPERVVAGGEAVTPAFRETVHQAWGCPVFNLYATTETGALAAETPEGTYLFEDITLVEVVDAYDRAVPDGECGHHLLITCLERTTQPLIRYRVSDQVIVDPPRGTGFPPFRQLRAVEGRVRDSLRLRNHRGKEVELRPAYVLAGLLALPGVRQVRVVQDSDEILVSVVGTVGKVAGLPANVQAWFHAAAREYDLQLPRVTVKFVSHLGGSEATMGKFRPVECRLPS